MFTQIQYTTGVSQMHRPCGGYAISQVANLPGVAKAGLGRCPACQAARSRLAVLGFMRYYVPTSVLLEGVAKPRPGLPVALGVGPKHSRTQGERRREACPIL